MTNSHSNLKLRPYQERALSLAREQFIEGKKRVLFIAPTGAGKSVIFKLLAFAPMPSTRVVILTHRRQLLKQAAAITREKPNVSCQMEQGFFDSVSDGKQPWPNLLIIDEAHVGNFRKTLEACPASTRVLGFTATPILAKNDKVLADYYDSMVELVTIEDCIGNGWLCDYTHKLPKVSGKLDIKKSGGEYSSDSQISEFDKNSVNSLACKNIRELKGKVVVFCVDTKHAEAVAKACDADFLVHSKMPKQTVELQINLFTQKKGRCVMVSCDILTTGFDCPDITDVVLLRRTTSLSLYLQMVGRGSRLAPGKSSFTVWDWGGNYYDHGQWSDYRDWNYYFKTNRSNPRTMVSPSKSCKACDALNPAQARTCKYCGTPFPVKPKEEKPEAELEGFVEAKPIDQKFLHALRDVQIAEKLSTGKVYARIKKFAQAAGIAAEPMLKSFGQMAGYKEKWYVSIGKILRF